jgi:membrane-associated phospholipid phosphatase
VLASIKYILASRDLPLRFLATREISLVVGCYLAYAAAKNAFDSTPVLRAFGNAWKLVNLEKALGLHVEARVQVLTARMSDVFLYAIAWFYWVGLWVGLIATAVLLFTLRRKLYFEMRTIFLVTLGTALVIFAIYPLAPPRMLPGYGVSDMVTLLGLNPMENSRSVFSYNKFAAMPSLHVTWAALIALAWARAGWKWPTIVGVIYFTLMTFAVIATANHYTLDVVGGLALLAFAVWWVLYRNQRPRVLREMPPEYYRKGSAHVVTATHGVRDSTMMSGYDSLLHWP